MKYAVSAVFGLLIAVGLAGRSQVAGGLSWAAVTIGIDFYWQWFRWRRIQFTGSRMVWQCVSSGFMIRVFSILLAVWLARCWFLPGVFDVYIMALLTLPIWNIIAVYYPGKGK